MSTSQWHLVSNTRKNTSRKRHSVKQSTSSRGHSVDIPADEYTYKDWEDVGEDTTAIPSRHSRPPGLGRVSVASGAGGAAAASAAAASAPSVSYCNNCGEAGHLFKNCVKPIISCGLIVYKNDSDGVRRYLMIQRKDSFGFIDFLRGRYSITNKNQIMGLIDEMTKREKAMIIADDFKKMWSYMWGSSHAVYGSEEYNAEEKLHHLRRGVTVDGETYTLGDLIRESKTSWDAPEWGFPKGRRNLHEKNIQTALREFSEETGYPQSAVDIISNLAPYEELFMGSNFKSYRHIYFIAQMSSTDYYDSTKFQKSEVRSIGWKTIEECISLIRPYSVEKINLIDKIDRVLGSNTIIS
jgi:8-oxo-dGTP pyrophosphatase MutT (NUDIX family)